MGYSVVIRVCASCEWVFKSTDPTCPKCAFGSYGARFVYGNKCYAYLKNQKPWKDRKLVDYERKLNSEIQQHIEELKKCKII